MHATISLHTEQSELLRYLKIFWIYIIKINVLQYFLWNDGFHVQFHCILNYGILCSCFIPELLRLPVSTAS
jgi:hypothetical protein